MKATGIVRRIDDLGRVVIPKEIRRTMRIREGDPLEIFTDREGEIIFKKYSPMGELAKFAKEYADSLSQAAGHITCITDKDHVIAVSGGGRKELADKALSPAMESAMDGRKTVVASRNDRHFVPLLAEDEGEAGLYRYQLITPILSGGDVLGAVVFFSAEHAMGEVEGKLAQTAAGFLGRQMEQ